MPTNTVMGYATFSGSVSDLVQEIVRRLRAGECRLTLACLNPHSFAVARGNHAFRDSLSKMTWLVPDGIGVVIASRCLGSPLRERITGADVFHRLNSELQRQGGARVFFLGSNDNVLQKISDRMSADYPSNRVVGTYSPPYRDRFSAEECLAMKQAIDSARPDVLWVGMTAPKQELWISEMAPHLSVGAICAVGAVFDFYAGSVERPSAMLQRLGLEWLARLLKEPARLWRRTLVSGPIFVFHMFLDLTRRVFLRDRS